MTSLTSLGLSEAASRVYEFLVSNPEDLSLEEIASGCRIPLDEAQKAIEELMREQLITVERNRFSALPPKRALAALLKRREERMREELASVRDAVSALERKLEPIFWEVRSGMKPEEIIEPLGSLSDMELRTAEMIGRAGDQILIFTGRFDWYDKVSEVLAQALDRGVKVNVLMRITDETARKRAEELRRQGIRVRHATEEWYPIRGTLVDQRELVFLIWATRKERKPLFFRPSYTTNPGLIRIFLDAFERRWERAKELEELVQ